MISTLPRLHVLDWKFFYFSIPMYIGASGLRLLSRAEWGSEDRQFKSAIPTIASKRVKYETDHLAISIRVSHHLYKQFKMLGKWNGKNLDDILREALKQRALPSS